jgi:hypothetical protein
VALKDNLVAVWELDEASGNAIDVHGPHDAAETDGTIGAASGPSGLSGARDLEAGDTEWFAVADHDDLSGADADWAVCGWFHIESAGTRVVVSKWLTTGNQREFQVLTISGILRFTVSGNGTAATSVDDTTSLSTATWYWFCCWHDAAANTINIQVNNGTPVSIAHSTGTLNGTGNFVLGAQSAGGSPWDGLLAQIAYWKGRYPTSDERAEIYAAGAGLPYADWDAAGGDVTVALTGQSLTATAGTLTPANAVALSGSALTAAAGTLTVSNSVALSGSALTAAAGTLTVSNSVALSGSSLTASTGTLAPALSVPLSGAALSITAGTLTATGGDAGNVTVALTGQSLTISAGTLTPETSVALSGSGLTAAAGTLAPELAVALAGAALSVVAGTLTASGGSPLVPVPLFIIRIPAADSSRLAVPAADASVVPVPVRLQ